MRLTAAWIGALLATALVWNPAAADDTLPVLTLRHFWTLTPAENPPDVDWLYRKDRGINEAWVTSDGGLMIWAYETPSLVYTIKLDASGTVQFWKNFYACPDQDLCNYDSRNLRIIRAADGGAFVQLPYALIRFDGDVVSRIPIPGTMQVGHIRTLVARDGSIFFSGSHSYRNGCWLYRVRPDGTKIWGQFVALSLKGRAADGWTDQIREMANGDILWTMSDYWYGGGENQWRLLVMPNGVLRKPGRIVVGDFAPDDNSREPGVAYLRDGRLLRYGKIQDGEDKGRYRLEFWDGIRDRLLATRLVELRSLELADAFIGDPFFVEGSDLLFFWGYEKFLSTPGTHEWIVALDDAGQVRWRTEVGSFRRIRIPGTSSFYVIDSRSLESDEVPIDSIHLLELEVGG